MVFSLAHLVPSALAAVLTLCLVLLPVGGYARVIAALVALSAFLGLIGFFLAGGADLLSLSPHAIHSWIGIIAFILALNLTVQFALKHSISSAEGGRGA